MMEDLGNLSPGITKINQAFLGFITKKEGASKPARPISLINVAFKIFSKILANRVQPYLNYLISSSHSAFIKGRGI